MLPFKLRPKVAIRSESQYMYTEFDLGDWATQLIEVTFAPHWFVAALDQYNFGNSNPKDRIHYYYFTGGYTNGGNRISIGYGRQREGIFCVGGVCRNVPSSNGVALQVTSSF